MNWSRFGRRTILGGTLAGLSGRLLAACGSGGDPGPMPSATPRGAAPRCVVLAEHTFHRGGYYCERDNGGFGGGQDSMTVPLDHRGPLTVTAETLTSYYIDAVMEWDIATGEPIRLLAPKRADTWLYTRLGEWTVNPRCDGALVVHQEGCATAELVGHAATGVATPEGTADGIQGLCWVAGDLVSLGADDTLRRWQVGAATQQASVRISPAAGNRTLGPGPETGTLLVSTSSRVEVFDAETLQSREIHDGLPPSVGGWVSGPMGKLAGIAAGDEPGLMILDTATGSLELIATGDPPGGIAVSGSGLVAVVDGPMLVLRRPDGASSEVRLADPSHQTGAAAFSPDGALLHILDQRTGIHTVEVASGHTVTTYRELAPI